MGLGLIGGSIAKAIKQNTSHRVLGMDINDDVLLDACSCGAIDGKAAPSDLERADLVYLSIYPEDILEFVRQHGSRLKPGCVLTDACGIKQEICAAMEDLSQNAAYEFVAGHPMAGKEQSGFAASDPSIFMGASYILVPGNASPQAVAVVESLARQMGFGRVVKVTAQEQSSAASLRFPMCWPAPMCSVPGAGSIRVSPQAATGTCPGWPISTTFCGAVCFWTTVSAW